MLIREICKPSLVVMGGTIKVEEELMARVVVVVGVEEVMVVATEVVPVATVSHSMEAHTRLHQVATTETTAISLIETRGVVMVVGLEVVHHFPHPLTTGRGGEAI